MANPSAEQFVDLLRRSGLVAICDKMLAKSPDDRYRTADQLVETLTAWLMSRS